MAMLAGITAMGLATGTSTHHLDPVLRQRWGFAFADFWHGTWYTLLTAIFMTDRPLMFWGILPFTGCSVGVYEWLAGTRRVAWLYGLTDLGGNLGLALIMVLPLDSLGSATGYDLAHSHDVGMSGGGFGCLGGWISRLPDRWRHITLGLAAVYLLVRLLLFTQLSADLLHLLTFFGGYAYATWQAPPLAQRRS